MEVMEDIQKEHEKETGKLKKVIAELLDMIVSLKNRNEELDEKRKKALSDYYETAVKLEEAQGLILKLTAQVNHNLLFLSNPLVEPDNNLCERKARILKGKINQAISLRSFQHLKYFCECLSVLDHFATDDKNNLYQSIKEIFKKPQPKLAKVKSERIESSN